MSNYIVKIPDERYCFIVTADDISWDHNGLKFVLNRNVVAMFLNWSFWFEIGKVEIEKVKEQISS